MKTTIKFFIILLVTLQMVACVDTQVEDVIQYPKGCFVGLAPSDMGAYNFLMANDLQPVTPGEIADGISISDPIHFRSEGDLSEWDTKVITYAYTAGSVASDKTGIFSSFDGLMEVRAPNGWSNLGAFAAAGYKYSQVVKMVSSTTDEKIDGTDVEITKNTYTISKEDLTTPPAYLHLTLSSVDDFNFIATTVSSVEQKIWKVSKIVNENGIDITNDPSWSCYLDNTYTFRKNGTVKYEPGAVSCDIDETLADNNLQSVYLGFTLEPEFVDFNNPGKISLSFDIPPLGDEIELKPDNFTFEVVSSDFQSAVFKITKSTGETAELHLIPAE